MNRELVSLASRFVDEVNRPKRPDVIAPKLTREQRAELVEHEVTISRLAKRTTEDMMEIGKRLFLVKEMLTENPTNPRLPAGDWKRWLREKQPNISAQLAEDFIKIYRTYDKDQISGLPIAKCALLDLANERVPEDVRKKALDKAKEGTYIGECEARKFTLPFKPPRVDDHRSRFNHAVSQHLKNEQGLEAAVFTKFGIADFVTRDAVYHVEYNYGHNLPRALGQALLLRHAIGLNRKAIIVTNGGKDFEAAREAIKASGAELMVVDVP